MTTQVQNEANEALEDLLIYRLSDRIWLAGQPQPDQMDILRQVGVRTLINMRTNAELSQTEAENAAKANLDYLFLPLPAYELEPQHMAEFEQIMADIEAQHDGIICIHCRTASRVALIWMLRRMIFENWSEEAAEAELVAAGYDDDSLETFRFCVDDYYERLAEAEEEAGAEALPV